MKFVITTAVDADAKRVWLELDSVDINFVVDAEVVAWIAPSGEFHVERDNMSNVGIWFEKKGDEHGVR